MRVLVTADTVGGVWTYSLELARGLRALGIEVVLATMGAPLTADQRRDAERAGLAGLHESDYALEWMHEPWDDVDAAGEWLQRVARAESVELVQSASYAHGAVRWGRPVVIVAHSCVVSWWRAVHHGQAPAQWDRYRERVRAGLHAADAVVAPTPAMRDGLTTDYGIAAIVIANGSSADEDGAAKAPYILSAGRMWDRAKGIDTLDAAARDLRWPVLAAGEGGAAGNLRLMGRLAPADLARLRARAAIFAAPARYEPFGLGILEAARAGCALVLGDIRSLRELWTGAALFVDPDDPAALHAALEQLIERPGDRRRLACAARLRARRFSVERMARVYARLYARLLLRDDPSSSARLTTPAPPSGILPA